MLERNILDNKEDYNVLLSDILDQNSNILSLLHIHDIFYLKDFLTTETAKLPVALQNVQSIFKDVYLNELYEIDNRFFNKTYFLKELKSRKSIVSVVNEIAGLLRNIGLSDDETIEVVQGFAMARKNGALFDFIIISHLSFLEKYRLILIDYYLKREVLKRRQGELLTQSSVLLRKDIVDPLINQNIVINADLLASKDDLKLKDSEDEIYLKQSFRFLAYYCYKEDLEVPEEIFKSEVSLAILFSLGFNYNQIEYVKDNINEFENYNTLELLEVLKGSNLDYGIPWIANVLINYYNDKYTLKRIK